MRSHRLFELLYLFPLKLFRKVDKRKWLYQSDSASNPECIEQIDSTMTKIKSKWLQNVYTISEKRRFDSVAEVVDCKATDNDFFSSKGESLFSSRTGHWSCHSTYFTSRRCCFSKPWVSKVGTTRAQLILLLQGGISSSACLVHFIAMICKT